MQIDIFNLVTYKDLAEFPMGYWKRSINTKIQYTVWSGAAWIRGFLRR